MTKRLLIPSWAWRTGSLALSMEAARGTLSQGEVLHPLLLGAEAFPDRPGGLNRYTHDLFAALKEFGDAPRLVVVGPATAPADPGGVVSDGPLPFRLWRVRRRARELAGSHQFVDAHFALYAAPPLLTGAIRGSPFMVHFHGPWAEESVAAGERSTAAIWLKGRLERVVYRRAKVVVVLSGAFKRLLVEQYAVAPWSVVVIPPSVNTEHFAPGDRARARAALGLPADDPLMVAVRRLVPRVGLDVLLHACARVPRALLVLVGEGPDRPRLAALAGKLGILDRVRFAGKVSDHELPEWYRAADICVLPSLQLEGFGLAALEAMSCGTPVVASDAGGLPEALRGVDHQVVVPRGDPGALAARLTAAISGAAPLPSRERCRQHALGYTKEMLARRHHDLYRRLVRPPRSRRLRVVYVDHCAKVSGAELALARLIRAVERIDAHVILGEDGPLVPLLHQLGISVEVLPLHETAREVRREHVRLAALGLQAPVVAGTYALRLARRLHALQPDLVHTNSLKSGLYGTLAARACRTPVVWHLHDRLSPDYLPDQAVVALRRAVRTLPNAVVANSKATLASIGPINRRAAAVVPNPVTPPGSAAELRRAVERIGIVGRLAPWKGQDVFLEGFSRAFADTPPMAVIVGAALFGEEGWEQRLHRHVHRLGLGGRVEFRGFRSDVLAEMRRLDVIVHASVVAEPFGQVIVEAMAAGVPVVATSAGGAAELVQHDVNGLLYPPGDADALAEALRRLAGDLALRRRLARAGRERAGAFRPENVAPRLEEVYAHLLGRPDLRIEMDR
jgi:glycosyltransferase involved in cell wall biosynthesis